MTAGVVEPRAYRALTRFLHGLVPLALLFAAGCAERSETVPGLEGLGGRTTHMPGPPPTAPYDSPSVYRIVGDFDGDGRDDYAVGEACGTSGACQFEVLRATGSGDHISVGSIMATYDEVGLCPGSPPHLVTTVRQGTIYDRLDYVIGSDSVWVAHVDTSSIEGGGPPDSWWARECSEGLRLYESTEADVATRGDSSWRPLTLAF